jgi:hypothetical protein
MQYSSCYGIWRLEHGFVQVPDLSRARTSWLGLLISFTSGLSARCTFCTLRGSPSPERIFVAMGSPRCMPNILQEGIQTPVGLIDALGFPFPLRDRPQYPFFHVKQRCLAHPSQRSCTYNSDSLSAGMHVAFRFRLSLAIRRTATTWGH